MKNVRLLFVVGLFAVMSLALLAEEPQGGGAQGAPAPAELAKPLSTLVIVSAIVLIATQLFRLWRMRRRPA